jgi:hypothetical protein
MSFIFIVVLRTRKRLTAKDAAVKGLKHIPSYYKTWSKVSLDIKIKLLPSLS